MDWCCIVIYFFCFVFICDLLLLWLLRFGVACCGFGCFGVCVVNGFGVCFRCVFRGVILVVF